MARSYAMILGQHIKRLREAAGLSQQGLGTLIGYTAPAVCYWENGINAVPVEALILIAQALGTSVASLVSPIDAALAQGRRAKRHGVMPIFPPLPTSRAEVCDQNGTYAVSTVGGCLT